jgi:3-oxoacyl-ACP reductase-like protein
MSIFGTIMSAIFKHAGAAAAPAVQPSTSAAPASTPAASPAPSASSAPASASASASPAPGAPVDVAAILTKLAAQNKEQLDWKHSIVDLMKLLNLDSSLAARKELATELHYTGNESDTATMNVWLIKQVMKKLAENGGVVPAELKH